MTTKEQIVENWLPRYTGTPVEEFGNYILLTNFGTMSPCLPRSSGWRYGAWAGPCKPPLRKILPSSISEWGSPMAATVMDLLSAINPKAVLFLGKCGGLKKTQVGDLILPIAAIRGEGTSDDYMPPEIPALPSFRLQSTVSAAIKKQKLDYWTGTVYTTNRRIWEHDASFKEYLQAVRAMAIDMETATIFIVGFANSIPHGALLLVSDNPLVPEGVKTEESDKKVTASYVKQHLDIGIEALTELARSGESVKHLRFEN
jgi:AMP nucleosidase